jgi:hypothetical protein
MMILIEETEIKIWKDLDLNNNMGFMKQILIEANFQKKLAMKRLKSKKKNTYTINNNQDRRYV